MVVIPTARDIGYAGTRSGRVAPNGPTPMVGAAMSDAGRSVVSAAYDLEALRQQEVQDIAADKGNVVSTRINKFYGDEEQLYNQAQDNSSESGIGFARQVVEGFRQRAKAFADQNWEGLTPDQQTRLNNDIIARSNDLYAKADAFETKQKGLYYDRSTNQDLDGIRLQIRSNSAPYDELRKRGEDTINSKNMPEAWKAVRRAAWANDADESRVAFDYKVDPQGTINKLSGGKVGGTVVDKIIGNESSGDPNAVPRDSSGNRLSSASGLGQFIDSTWLSMIHKYRPDVANGKTSAEILALKTDRALGREMTAKYTQENSEFLSNQGIQATDGNVYLAHFLGPRGAAQVLKADPNTPISSIVDQSAMSANSFLAGKTAGDLRAWADKKMGGAGVSSTSDNASDTAYPGLTYDNRMRLESGYTTEFRRQQTERKATDKADIDLAMSNAPLSFQNTGRYDGNMPSQDQFTNAFGAIEGKQRMLQFAASVQAGQEAFKFQTMPENEIRAAVAAARPTEGGNVAEAEQMRYDALTKAADETIKARKADPVKHVQQFFSDVAEAWRSALTAEPGTQDISHALAVTAAAQQQLGIGPADQKLVPANVADTTVRSFQNAPTDDQRLDTLTGLIFATADPQQRYKIFQQLVDAGVPVMAEGALEALSRGDRGAARRLLLAASVKPEDLPKVDDGVKVTLDDKLYDEVWAPGMIGSATYGIGYGDTRSAERAARGAQLLKKAVQFRRGQGEDVYTAIEGASRDLFGDMKVFPGFNEVHAELAVPKDVDDFVLGAGLSAAKNSTFKDALVKQRDKLLSGEDIPTTDGQRAIVTTSTENRINDVLANGIFRQTGNGIGLLDPYTGLFVAGDDGRPLTVTIDDMVKLGQTAPPPAEAFTKFQVPQL